MIKYRVHYILTLEMVNLSVVKNKKAHRSQDDIFFTRFSSCLGDSIRGDVSNPPLCRQLFTTSSALLPERQVGKTSCKRLV